MNIDEAISQVPFDLREQVLEILSSAFAKADSQGAKIRRMEKALTRYLADRHQKRANRASSAAMSVLKGNKEKVVTKAEGKRILKAVESAFKGIDTEVESRLRRDMEQIYKINKVNFIGRFGLTKNKKWLTFDGVRKKIAVEKVNTHALQKAGEFSSLDELIWQNLSGISLVSIGDHFPTELKPAIAKAIQEGVIARGLNKEQASLFLSKELTKVLGSTNLAVPKSFKMKGLERTNAYFKGLSATNINFATNFGQITAMEEAQIERYEIVAIMDNLTSEICASLNGRTFSVERGVQHRDKILDMESVSELKDYAPWRKDLSEFGLKAGQKLDDKGAEAALASAGLSTPPYHFRCYDKKTEVYTKDGFIPFRKVKVGDLCLSLNPITKDLEWVPILFKQEREHNDYMLKLTNHQNSLNMMITPDHTMFYYKRVDHGKAGRTWEPAFGDVEDFCRAGDKAKLYVSSNWIGESLETVDINGLILKAEHFCRFMGFYLSDGSVKDSGAKKIKKYYVVIAQSDGQEKMFKELLEMGFQNVTKTKGKIHIYDSRLGDYCKQFGKASKKFIPDLIKSMDKTLIQRFLDAFNQCDGYTQHQEVKFKGIHFRPMRKYFTTSKRMADDLGELLIKCGKSCSYLLEKRKGTIQKFKNGSYKINHDLWNVFEIRSKHRIPKIVKRCKYSGMVYDVTLGRNHTLLTRRGGKVVWGSNCRTEVHPA